MEQLYTYFNATNLSVFVASIVAIFSAYQALLLRKHNRLSVRPHITDWTRHQETNIKGKHFLRYFIENNGLGPAIIKDMEISFDGKVIGENKKPSELISLIKTIIEESDLEVHFGNCAILGYGSSLREGKEIATLTLDCYPTMGTPLEDFEVFMDRFDLRLRYKSIYGEDFVLDTSKPPICY